MKFEKYLAEERIQSATKRAFIGAIKKPKKDTIKVGEREILVTPKGKGVSFIFDENLYELSMTLADLVDSLGEYTVEQAKKNKKIMFTVSPKE